MPPMEESNRGKTKHHSIKGESDRKLYIKVNPRVPPTRTSTEDDAILDVVNANDDCNPILIHNEHFTGHAVFRIRNFNGWTPIDERTGLSLPSISNCEYFNNHSRTFSLQISGRFRQKWTADDIIFGTFFEKPLNLPPGYKIALSLASRIDPSMSGDFSVSKPYMFSPIICAMNTINIQPLLTSPQLGYSQSHLKRFSSIQSSNIRRSLVQTASDSKDDSLTDFSKPLTLPQWKWFGNHSHMEENLLESWCSMTTNKSLLFNFEAPKKSNTAEARRKLFLDENIRKKFVFHPDTVYSFDFANKYCDLNKMTLSLGLSFRIERYLGNQPVRYQCKTRDGKIIFWTIEFGLE